MFKKILDIVHQILPMIERFRMNRKRRKYERKKKKLIKALRDLDDDTVRRILHED